MGGHTDLTIEKINLNNDQSLNADNILTTSVMTSSNMGHMMNDDLELYTAESELDNSHYNANA